MNAKTIFAVAAFAALASAAARADDITIDNTPFQSSRTRAEVRAELMQNRQSGYDTYATDYNQLSSFQSSLTRDQVRAEYLADRNVVAAMTGEDAGSAYLTQLAAANARADRMHLAGTSANAR
ncbi:hypothetical protein GCM10027034_33780 [Ramlibacter solisilvae]|uniref:DUF4148 domain-containing protein n=1 Tax=Ramlibacter tataouinensis TaxID=94132 RepID=A0A127JSB8_9BURK|nr:DUF4148 domain-containing protein [Ramlibacter tataouinensis]AMO22884.1 hypothetical protein UC35_08260 [Ramlibacter tataouinensis]